MSYLWGPEKSLDFWTARKAGLVPPGELRAMQLLSSLSDEKRFSFYCLSGHFPAMGNMTKNIYMVRRFTTVLEIKDGRPEATWCILTRDRGFIPESDHVLALKNLIEGEEWGFRKTGNRSSYLYYNVRAYKDIKIPNSYMQSFGAPEPEISKQADLSDIEDLEGLRKAMVSSADWDFSKLRRKAHKWVTITVKPKLTEAEKELISLRAQLATVGAGRWGNSSTANTAGFSWATTAMTYS